MGSRGRAQAETAGGEEDKGQSGQDFADSPMWTLRSLGSMRSRIEGVIVSQDLNLQGMKRSVLGWGWDVLEIDIWGDGRSRECGQGNKGDIIWAIVKNSKNV